MAALAHYAPAEIRFTSPHAAELIVLHAVGRRDQVQAAVDWGLQRRQRIAVIQYALRSTQKPQTGDWIACWQAATVVWSYYDLSAWCQADGCDWGCENFYHAPLGVETADFTRQAVRREFLVMTHGTSWLTEGVREAVLAARRHGGRVYHLGPHIRRTPEMLAEMPVHDAALARRYSQCYYVAPLRRIEGFELPAAEGVICGARPILYDRPHYRHWYGDLAEYVPEGDRADVIEALDGIFSRPYRAVTDAERAAAAERFYWPPIVKGFWDRCLAA